MATAAPPATTTQPPNSRAGLALASLVGGLLILAGVVAAGYGLPTVWAESVAPVVDGLGVFASSALYVLAAVALVALFVGIGSTVAGSNPPKGLRGGIFVVISLAIAAFFIVRAVGLNFEGGPIGMPLTAAVAAVMLVIGYLLLMSPGGQRFMVAVEEQGWLSTFAYKRTQGIRARRYTLIGFLIIGWTGVWTLKNSRYLADRNADLIYDMPFTDWSLHALPNIGYTIPVLLAVAVFWLAWRVVNVPAFADFLIATEAEMNKVSWSSRKRLVQDTIVVLVTVFLLAAFLFVVDWFWSTLLSSQYIEVLPTPSTNPATQQGAKVDW